jgi:hypothetical protein
VTAKPKRSKYEKPNEAITSPPTTGIETALMPKIKSFSPKYLPLNDGGTMSEIRAVDATVVAHHPRPIISIPRSTMRFGGHRDEQSAEPRNNLSDHDGLRAPALSASRPIAVENPYMPST